MPKKNLLISAALTAFILVIATSIASAYQRVNATLETVKADATSAASVEVVQQVEQTTITSPVATEEIQVMLTHQEAALLAANFLEQTDLYSVENIIWEGTDAYKVVFTSGDTVYIGMYGDILGTEAAPVTVITTTNNTSGARPASNNTSNGSHHDDDDHDDHDDHDD